MPNKLLMGKREIIAFYLPQFHPTADNDNWWGKGFTEWTNVGKAKPLFKGHYQPKVPADLGYYDLRIPEVRQQQTDLAIEAGITGFCYYHYWFGNRKLELERPFEEVLKTGKPDFPFMLCWANESWHKKFWDNDGKGNSRQVLIEQTYPGERDIIDHFNYLLPAFKDSRYMRKDGRPMFMIYCPLEHPAIHEFITIWNRLGIESGIGEFYFIAQLRENNSEENQNKCFAAGFNAINVVRLGDAWRSSKSLPGRILEKALSIVTGIPRVRKYDRISSRFCTAEDRKPNLLPTMIPNWDHTPRSGKNGAVLTNSTPKQFEKHAMDVLRCLEDKPDNDRICFIKSWNEWGEGNYMEPDLKYGHGYIQALRSAVDHIDGSPQNKE